MALSEEEIRKILEELEAGRNDVMKSKDLDRIITNGYHPNGVIIHRLPGGAKTYYGREGQKETYGEVLSYGQTTDWSITTTYVESSGDGEYIIQRGTYRVGPDTKEYPFETIYRKHNGKYLILHEDCDCTPTP